MGRRSGILQLVAVSFLLQGCPAQNLYGQNCPQDWVSFENQCYNFVFYPTLLYEEASQACHHIGANLISVNSVNEHNFIAHWLSRYNTTSLIQWYTSGVDRNGNRQWDGDGNSFTSQVAFWIDPASETTVPSTGRYVEAHLVYEYSSEQKRYGWAWLTRAKSLPYMCEIGRHQVYQVLQQSRDFSFGTSSLDQNEWIVGPKFSLQSRSIVFAGHVQQVEVQCLAEGNPQPTYKWFRDFGTDNAVEISAQRNLSYTITNGHLTIWSPREDRDLGKYTCVAENSAGRVFGNPVRISSGYLGEFSNVKPGSRSAILFQGAVLNCNPPEYSPAITFQWMKEFNFIRPEMNQHTFLSENGNLYFSEIQASDAAEYHCIVTLVASPGEELATSQPMYRNSLGIELRVQGENANEFGPDIHDDFPAVFPKQPLRGQNLRLECLAYGRLPLGYTWSRVEGSLPNDRITFSSLYRVMQISDLRLEDSGTYTCIVVGPLRSHSKNITINVAATPYFLFPLRDQHLDVGSELTWVCEAVAVPRATYAWYRNGVPLITDVQNNITVNRNILVINGSDPTKHNGMYECVATNTLGSEISIAQIRVLSFQPNFEKYPVAKTILGTIGGSLTIPCRPEGSPEPTLSWSRNGSPLENSDRVQIMPNGNLVLLGLVKSDEGTYTCFAVNSIGSASSGGQLSVREQTTLTIQPQNQMVTQNSSAHMPCQASFPASQTDLVYSWHFNNKLIDTNHDPSFKVVNQGGVDGLYIIGAQFRHDGWYECCAVTVHDSVSSRAYLTVKGPPGQPAGVHVHSKRGTEVTLWWQPGMSHGEAITLYRIEFRNNFNPTWQMLVDGINEASTIITEYPNWRQYIIQDKLSPGTAYSFRVSAGSPGFGYGEPSLPSDVSKLDDAPPVYAPKFVTGGGGSVGMLTIRWTPLPPEYHGGEGLFYKVYWRLHQTADELWQVSENNIYDDNRDQNGMLVFHKLVGTENYYTQYDVKVQAINSMGQGPNSSVEIIYSAEDIPVTTPQGVYGIPINCTAGWAFWELPNDTREGVRGKVQGYQINYWHISEDRTKARFVRHYGTQKKGLIINLYEGNQDHWIDVQVFNTAGLSRPSGANYLITNYKAPLHYPEFVTVFSNGPDSVQVSWRGISTSRLEASVQGYKVWWWPYTENIRTAKVATFGIEFSGVIRGIEKDKLYKLRVLAWSLGGDGKESPPVYFTLGGQVRFDPLTSEILSSSSLLQSAALLVMLCTILSVSIHL